MTQVLFYERPVPLNRSEHKDLRIKPLPDMAFASKAHSVPLTCVEFPSASRDVPILFGGAGKDDAGPMALLGLRQNENLLVDDKGQWTRGAYVPAFVRRYPFVLAEKPEGAEGDDFTVFIDEDFAGFNKDEGERLFAEDGSDTEVLKNAVRFLGEFQEHVKHTQAFMAKLRELDLLEPRTVQINMPGKNTVLNGLFVVDEEKLRKLDAKTTHELFQNGWLGWIYAHLISLPNIDRLMARLGDRYTPEEKEAAAKAAAEAQPANG